MDSDQMVEAFRSMPAYRRHAVIFALMNDDLISFPALAQMHVQALENERDRRLTIEADLAASLAFAWKKLTGRRRVSAARALLQSKRFAGAPIESELQECVAGDES